MIYDYYCQNIDARIEKLFDMMGDHCSENLLKFYENTIKKLLLLKILYQAKQLLSEEEFQKLKRESEEMDFL
jgi:hypothetical protein